MQYQIENNQRRELFHWDKKKKGDFTPHISPDRIPNELQDRYSTVEKEAIIEHKKELKGWGIRFNKIRGPLIYRPYPGPSIAGPTAVKSVKPGFKIWVDGGVLDYPKETCVNKKLDCSGTCCMQSYCAPNMSFCLNYKRR